MTTTPLIDEKIDLFSNAVSGNGYVNTCDNFVNTLPEPLNMENVEVCVKQITLPTSWNPIPHQHRDKSRLRWIVTYNSDVTPFTPWHKVITGPHAQWVGDGHRSLLFTLQPGIYDTTKEIVEQMKKQTDAAFPSQEFNWPIWVYKTYESTPQRILIHESTNKATIFANARLCQALHYAQQDPHGSTIPTYFVLLFPPGHKSRDGTMLENDGSEDGGLQHYDIYNLTKLDDVFRPLSHLAVSSNVISPENAIHLDHKPDLAIDPTIQIQRFFFYADFIQDRVVNGEKRPLLASVHNPGLLIKKTTLTHTINYPIPLYIPVKPMTLQHLRVWILDDHDNPMSFSWGSANVLLHFRRRQGWDRHRLYN